MNGLLSRALPYLLSFFSSLCIMVLELVASRLVAQHVGGSLIVWTSVIGVILAGICLGNVLGGRLADRIAPERALGPLYAIGGALVLGCLWLNALIGYAPFLDSMPWDARTLFVVTLDFLVPATVLGMIGPVVAKMAVERSSRSGSAIGDVYMWGAIGSIVGTFLAGFYLIYLLPNSTIVTVVAAAYALLAAAMLGSRVGLILGLLAAGFLALGSVWGAVPSLRGTNLPVLEVGSTPMPGVSLVGHVLSLALAVLAGAWLSRDMRAPRAVETAGELLPVEVPRVRLTDLALLSFLISLAFMALEMVAGRLVQRHLGSSVYGWTSVIGVLLGGLSLGNYLGGKIADRTRSEKSAGWLFLAASVLTALIIVMEKPPEWMVLNPIGYLLRGEPAEPADGSMLSQAIAMKGYPWWFRVVFWTAVVFFVPAVSLGTVSPVVVKLAVERMRQHKRTGTAIGQVYAWGMVGSLLGTFLTGFVLIDVLGTKGMLLAIATVLALAATALGSVWHALWAGIPLGLCVIAFLPIPWLQKQALSWGIREDYGDITTSTGLVYADESDYYYIKVTGEIDEGAEKRTLVLDNLIHGYFILDHPERLDYDYEHIYALVTKRAMDGKPLSADPTAPPGTPLSVLFLGGGSYTFPRYLQHAYPGTVPDVAEIDPAVTRANHRALGLPGPESIDAGRSNERGIHTVWGDARQFVARRHDGPKKYDIVFGDAFNDFSVPWHLTTREFNEMIADMLTDDGVYMINIIDVYQSDEIAREEALAPENPSRLDPEQAVAKARSAGGFLGSWVETARLTFPHIYVFGTDTPIGSGLRETFVVVASKRPLDLADLGLRPTDPQFYKEPKKFEPYDEGHMQALKVRSQGIILTDDYAPVENLLAPVAATRGDD